jgi:hypothetical protein
LGQVMQTRPILAYGASYLGGVIATASPCILASIPLVIGFVGGYAGGNKKQAFFYSLTLCLRLGTGDPDPGGRNLYRGDRSYLQSKTAKVGTMIQKAAGGLIFFVGCYILFQGIRNW